MTNQERYEFIMRQIMATIGNCLLLCLALTPLVLRFLISISD